jgi:hypothetical protein
VHHNLLAHTYIHCGNGRLTLSYLEGVYAYNRSVLTGVYHLVRIFERYGAVITTKPHVGLKQKSLSGRNINTRFHACPTVASIPPSLITRTKLTLWKDKYQVRVNVGAFLDEFTLFFR